MTSSYWDTQTTGQSTSAGGAPATTQYLTSGSLPTGFDPGIWSATAGQYPTLKGVGGQTQPLSASVGVELSKLAYLPLGTIQSGNLPAGYDLPPGYTAIAALNETNGIIVGEHALAFKGPDGTITVAFEGTARYECV